MGGHILLAQLATLQCNSADEMPLFGSKDGYSVVQLCRRAATRGFNDGYYVVQLSGVEA